MRAKKKKKTEKAGEPGTLYALFSLGAVGGLAYVVLRHRETVFPVLGYAVVALAALLVLIAAWRAFRRISLARAEARRYALDQDFDLMNGRDFEYWCANLLERVGFEDVTVTQGSNDQGVDIIAVKNGERYAVQCKRYASPLGNKPVQEVAAGRNIYNCDRAAVMTNNFFTDGARRAAFANDVELWDRDDVLAMQKAAR